MPGSSNNQASGQTRPFRVLVVDDEPLLGKMVSAMLRRAGYEIMMATTGREALAMVKKDLPDLITLDVMMPDISGLEVARRLRADPQTASIPIIFLTALDRSVSVELRRLAGEPNTYHLDKPFSRQQLMTQVEAALAVAQGERAL